MKLLSQSGSSNFCPELRKNALLISQSHFSNFALHMIMPDSGLISFLKSVVFKVDFKVDFVAFFDIVTCLKHFKSSLT